MEDLSPETPVPPMLSKQKVWAMPRVISVYDSILASCNDEVSRARLLAASSTDLGAWLHAPLISSHGLRMSDDTIQIAMGLRIGAPLSQPHECVLCGFSVNQLARHGLHCRHSQGRLSCHGTINSIIKHSLLAAKIPSHLESSGLLRSDSKCPDDIIMVP